MLNGRLIYTICRKLFYTICHLCIKNLHYHRRQAWTRLNNHLRGPYSYNSYHHFRTPAECRVQHITETAVTAYEKWCLELVHILLKDIPTFFCCLSDPLGKATFVSKAYVSYYYQKKTIIYFILLYIYKHTIK